MRILLLAPATGGSGAASYNARMVAALREQGHAADLVPLYGRYPATAADPRDLALLPILPADAHLVLDGLAMALLPALHHPATALIHQPSALLADQPSADQPQLAARERAALTALPRLIAASAAAGARLTEEYGVPSSHIRVVPAGVDDGRRTLPTAGPCHILTLGPLVPRRAHDILLHALARLTDLDWHLTLIGSPHRDPAYALTLRALIAQTGLAPRVTLQDAGTQLPWPTTDVLALAHPAPGQDGVLRQALRRGIPLVLCTTMGPPSPGGAAICPPDDPDTLSKVLRRLIFDTALRRRMADAAYQTGQTLPNWAAQAEKFADALL